MNSRMLLKQCFNCKYNFECWHLNDELSQGKDSRILKLKKLSTIKFYFHNSPRELTELEYMTIRTCINAINPDIKKDEVLSNEYTQMVMLVLEGLSNASNEFWSCPGLDDDAEESYLYDPIR